MKYTIYSLKTKYILKDVTAQIISYVDHPGRQLTILSKSIQQQVTGVNYGVYAIWKRKYDKKKITLHLIEYLKMGKLTPLPTITGEVVRCAIAISNIEL